MKYIIKGEKLSVDEIRCYEKIIREKYPDRKMDRMVIEVDGEYVDITTYYGDVPFERIRRITGYQTARMKKHNDVKRAESDDRVRNDFAPSLIQ